MIEVKNLTKKYGNNTAVRNLSFTIGNGKIYGLLGPNGAGKSTTMNIITGCLAATSGTVLIDGHDIFEEPLEAKKHIGYLPEQPPLYMEMTPAEYLAFVAEAKGVPFEKRSRQIREVMKLTGITDVSGRLIMNLSKGYRQRVGIAQALIGEPDTIILDEPTVGLDPKQIIEIRQLIRDLGKNQTVIISSHILAEISAVCDHVLIISRGKLVANDSLADLERDASAGNGVALKVRADRKAVEEILKSVGGIELREIGSSGGVTTAVFRQSGSRDARDDVFFAFAEKRLPIIEMYTRESSLEDIFLSLIGSDLDGDGDIYDEEGGSFDADEEPDEAPAPASGEKSGARPEKNARKSDRQKDDEDDSDDYTPLFGGGGEEDDR